MEHTNLFLFENKAALDAAYPDGKVTTIPGVACSRASGSENYSVLFNNNITNYILTLQLQDKSGATVGTSVTAQTPNVLDGETIKCKVVAPEVENYKPRNKEEKIEISGDTSFTVVYLAATSYTITVHHMFSGESIAADTEVIVNDVFEEDVVKVRIEPEDISGYKADPVYISVSGDMEYTLEYEEDICYVDLGLPSGTLWACKNLGAEDEYDVGNLYAWGEIIPNKAEYTRANYRFYDGQNYTKYNDNDNKTELELVDDAANVELGGEWHIPTVSQLYELLENTTRTEGNGYVVFASNNNGNSIVIPKKENESCHTLWLKESYSLGASFCFAEGCEASYSPENQARYLGTHVRPVLGNSTEEELNF